MSKMPPRVSRSQLLFASFVLCAWTLAIFMSIKGAVPAIQASYAILHKDDYWNPSQNLEESIILQRQIQSHYLSYGVYIPLDDIVIGAHVSNSQPSLPLNEGVCGPGSTSIWVPVAFQFPIFGEKVFEWCLVRT